MCRPAGSSGQTGALQLRHFGQLSAVIGAAASAALMSIESTWSVMSFMLMFDGSGWMGEGENPAAVREIAVEDSWVIRSDERVTGRRVRVDSVERVPSSSGGKKPAKRRERMMKVSGDDGTVVVTQRVWDRTTEPPMYSERIWSLQDRVLYRDMCEPIACHRGRGSAKRVTFRDAQSWAISTLDPMEQP